MVCNVITGTVPGYPVPLYSQQLQPWETKYAVVDLKALALVDSVRHFHFYLSGRFFKVFTDHNAAVDIIAGNPPSSRLARRKEKLSEYCFDLIHVSGKNNHVADALSRQSWPPLQQSPPAATPSLQSNPQQQSHSI